MGAQHLGYWLMGKGMHKHWLAVRGERKRGSRRFVYGARLNSWGCGCTRYPWTRLED